MGLYSLDMVAESKSGRFHMFLTEVEYKNCIKIPGKSRRICRGRKPRIWSKMGDQIIHQIDYTSFAVKLDQEEEGQLSCKGQTETVKINNSCIVEIPLDCSLKTDTFEIPTSEKSNMDIPEVKFFKIKFNNPVLELLEKPKITNIFERDIKKDLKDDEDLLETAGTEMMEKDNEGFWENIHWPSVAPHIGWGVIFVGIIGIGVCCWCQNKNTLRNPFSGH